MRCRQILCMGVILGCDPAWILFFFILDPNLESRELGTGVLSTTSCWRAHRTIEELHTTSAVRILYIVAAIQRGRSSSRTNSLKIQRWDWAVVKQIRGDSGGLEGNSLLQLQLQSHLW